MLSQSDIHEALRACYDASHLYRKPVNVVDLGLVEEIELSVDADAPGAGIAGVPPRQVLALTLLAPSQDEDAQAQLRAQILNRLAGIPELWRASVRFAAEPAWTPDRISPEGRRLLAIDFPILNNRAK